LGDFMRCVWKEGKGRDAKPNYIAGNEFKKSLALLSF
jgi:hypothetical protein